MVPYTLSLGANALAKARRVCVRIQWSSSKVAGALMFLVCRKCGPHTGAVLCKPLAAYMNSWSSCRACFSCTCLLTCACACCCASTGLVHTEASHSQYDYLVVCVYRCAGQDRVKERLVQSNLYIDLLSIRGKRLLPGKHIKRRLGLD